MFISCSTVCAGDNATNDVVGIDENNVITAVDSTGTDSISVENDNIKNNQIIGENNKSAGTFDELSSLIINTSNGGTIELEKDYIYNSTTDSSYQNGITISKTKTISIDGKGHILDGNSESKIFRVLGSNVI